MSLYAYVDLETGLVRAVRYHETAPDPAPHRIEVQEDEIVDKFWTYAADETPGSSRPSPRPSGPLTSSCCGSPRRSSRRSARQPPQTPSPGGS